MMDITLAEAIAVLLYLRDSDILTADETRVMTQAWIIISNEAERVIREATATTPT
jgi:hypothetical protein